MKNRIRLYLLGNPSIFLNQKEVNFSFAKVNALIFYLYVSGGATRDQVASLLWENKDTQSAKKNLRNTIYQANKELGFELITSPNRKDLALSNQLDWESDYASFVQQPRDHLALYKGDFLQGFYLKDGEAYDEWIQETRTGLEQLYLRSLYDMTEKNLETLDFEEAEKAIRSLIALDEFEERNYALLMQLYQRYDRPSKVIETYYQLANLLDRELGISPNETISQIYREVLAKDKNEKKIKQFLRTTDHFFGRLPEIEQLEAYFSRVLTQQEARTFILVGGTGIGKRTVTRQVLANQTKYFQIIMAECFKEEQSWPLQIWFSILDELEDLIIRYQLLSLDEWKSQMDYFFPLLQKDDQQPDLSQLSQFLVKVLKAISRKKALVLLIEDSHWLDSSSLLLLESLTNHLVDYPIAFILTKHIETPRAYRHFINHLAEQEKVEFAHLKSLSQEEARSYFEYEVGIQDISEEEWQEIYHISQGTPFLLTQYANQLAAGQKFTPLTAAIKAKYALKLEEINLSAIDLLDYMACQRGPANLYLLSRLTGQAMREVLDHVELMIEKNLVLEEVQADQVVIQHKERIVKFYMYDRLTPARKRLFHQQIAQAMEELIEEGKLPSLNLLEIAYHYKMAGQDLLSLEYRIQYLQQELQFQHDLYPIQVKASPSLPPMEGEEGRHIEEEFQEIKGMLNRLERTYESHRSYQLLLLQFLYLEGRFAIRSGQYRQGLQEIQKVISLARDLNQTHFLLEGYRQLIYYCVQSENIIEMQHYTDLGLQASVQANSHEDIAIHLRLRGLYYLMVGQEVEAEKYFKDSISYFRLTPNLEYKYAVQIGAALDYLAEIEQIRGHFAQAKEYSREALRLTQNLPAISSFLAFQVTLAYTYYLEGQIDIAEEMFTEIKSKIEELDFPWKEVQLEVYLALIHYQKGNCLPLKDLLARKNFLVARYENPRDKGLIYYLLSHISKQDAQVCDLKEFLEEDLATCLQIARQHLNAFRDGRLLSELDQIEKVSNQD